MDVKKCTKCGEIKPVSEFTKNKNTKDGLHCWCKACKNAAHGKYRKTKKYKAVKSKADTKYLTKIPPAIYQIRCLKNNKIYIGQSITPKRRETNHWARLNGGYHKNCSLQADYNLYGRDAFVFEVLEEIEDDALRLEIEAALIETTWDSNYNVTK
jgi:predicted GIY-YIG superfamily endonuclease